MALAAAVSLAICVPVACGTAPEAVGEDGPGKAVAEDCTAVLPGSVNFSALLGCVVVLAVVTAPLAACC